LSAPGAERGGGENGGESVVAGKARERADAGDIEGASAARPGRRPSDWLREQRRLPRGRLTAVAAVALVLFVAVSVLLARYLSAENLERSRVLSLLRAQAAGDAAAAIQGISGCRAHPNCVTLAKQNAAMLRRPGSVKILSLTSATAYALTGATGTTRVAWTVIGRLPVVQCVGVKRTGNPFTGISVALISLSAPIPNETDC
jgi:hypothetical protein